MSHDNRDVFAEHWNYSAAEGEITTEADLHDGAIGWCGSDLSPARNALATAAPALYRALSDALAMLETRTLDPRMLERAKAALALAGAPVEAHTERPTHSPSDLRQLKEERWQKAQLALIPDGEFEDCK